MTSIQTSIHMNIIEENFLNIINYNSVTMYCVGTAGGPPPDCLRSWETVVSTFFKVKN